MSGFDDSVFDDQMNIDDYKETERSHIDGWAIRYACGDVVRFKRSVVA